MVTEQDLKRDRMYYEATDRLELMEASAADRWMLLVGRELTKVLVNHEDGSVRRMEPTDEELKMVKEFEAQFKCICYYLIQDRGMYPDGCTFPRYSLLYVDEHEDEYEFGRDAITFCGTVPAYVMNLEEPSCSELTEFKFENVSGLIINVS